MKIDAEIKAFYPGLTKSEKSVADYIIKNKELVMKQTLSELSKNIGVGEATIIRCLKKVGFNALVDLKFKIARDIYDKENKEVTPDNYIDKIGLDMKNRIDDSRSLIDISLINQAISFIKKAQSIYFFGIGSSGLVAEIGSYRFFRMGVKTNAVTDAHYQSMQATVCTDKDVIIAVSTTGQTVELIDALKIAKEQGARIIAIVGYLNSDVAAIADIVLFSSTEKSLFNFSGADMSSIISQLFIVEVLVSGYMQHSTKKIKDIEEKITKSIAQHNKNLKS